LDDWLLSRPRGLLCSFIRGLCRIDRDRLQRVTRILDPENRKAVTRHLASLVREDSEQRLRAIVARSDDPEVQRIVAECKDEVARSTYHVIRSFKEARSLEHNEVRTTRAEAHDILNHLKNPPVDQATEP
jgi:hypothetical protein